MLFLLLFVVVGEVWEEEKKNGMHLENGNPHIGEWWKIKRPETLHFAMFGAKCLSSLLRGCGCRHALIKTYHIS